MEKLNLKLFWCQVQRLSMDEISKIMEKYEKELVKQSIVDINEIFRYLDIKKVRVDKWYEETYIEDMFIVKPLTVSNPIITDMTYAALRELNKTDLFIQSEIAFKLTDSERYNIVTNFGKHLQPSLIQNFIIASSNTYQRRMMIEYKTEILKSNIGLLTSFITLLDDDNQTLFLEKIREDIKNFNVEDKLKIILSCNEQNIEDMFEVYSLDINSLDELTFVRLLSSCNEGNLVKFSELFKEKLNTLETEVILYKLSCITNDSQILYDFFKNIPNKINEVDNSYFNLFISRLDDEKRLKSLTDFKEQYDKMDDESLLDIIKYDNDSMKVEVLSVFKDRISNLENSKFISYITDYISLTDNLNKIILEYKDKINEFNDKEFTDFIIKYYRCCTRYFTHDFYGTKSNDYSNFIVNEFIERFKKLEKDNLIDMLSETGSVLNNIIISSLKEQITNIINNFDDLSNLLKNLYHDSRNNLFKEYYEKFRELSAEDWYKLEKNFLNNIIEVCEELVLNCKIDNLDFITDKISNSLLNLFIKNIHNKSFKEYEEILNNDKNRLLIIFEELTKNAVNNNLNDLNLNYSFHKLIALIQVLIKNNIITTNNEYYNLVKEYLFNIIKNNITIENPNNIALIKDSLFYRLIKGSIKIIDLTIHINSLKGLIFLNKSKLSENTDDINTYRACEIESFVSNLTEEQVINVNLKEFKQVVNIINKKYEDNYPDRDSIRNLAIRLFLSVGYQKAMKLLTIDVPMNRLEYIFSSIDIKAIKLNENGEPIINKKLYNFMFGSNIDDKNTNINRLLNDEIPEFKSKFATVYNDWELIYDSLNGNVTVQRIIDYFRQVKVLLTPDEHRLSTVINEIGNNEKNITKARELYKKMRKRESSTIPKVIGNVENYTYEILDLDDPLGLVVGYITRCCFLIDGQSKSSLFHSAKSRYGRIFVVKKDDELIAQSWMWRNGNLVCFDNVETTGNYNKAKLLEVYMEAADKILKISAMEEDAREKIKLVTFGGRYSKIDYPTEKVKSQNIKLPLIEDEEDKHIYTDARYDQYILAYTEKDNLYYGDVKAKYKDSRKEVLYYSDLINLKEEEKALIGKKIRAINYFKTRELKDYNLKECSFIMLNDDWYFLVTKTNNIRFELITTDSRAKEEFLTCLYNLTDKIKEMQLDVDEKSLKENILNLVKGGVINE